MLFVVVIHDVSCVRTARLRYGIVSEVTILEGPTGAQVIILFTTYSFAVGFRSGALNEAPNENYPFLRCLMSTYTFRPSNSQGIAADRFAVYIHD